MASSSSQRVRPRCCKAAATCATVSNVSGMGPCQVALTRCDENRCDGDTGGDSCAVSEPLPSADALVVWLPPDTRPCGWLAVANVRAALGEASSDALGCRASRRVVDGVVGAEPPARDDELLLRRPSLRADLEEEPPIYGSGGGKSETVSARPQEAPCGRGEHYQLGQQWQVGWALVRKRRRGGAGRGGSAGPDLQHLASLAGSERQKRFAGALGMDVAE